MKYVYIILIFVLGVSVGRWSAPEITSKITHSQTETSPTITPSETYRANTEKILPSNESATAQNSKLLRTETKAKDKQVRDLFSQLLQAIEKQNLEEQNRLFAEMEQLEPQHEKVFEGKVIFLQDDENWDGAYEVLKECVRIIPNSLYCLRRLTNIRTSTTEEKLYYGTQCLEVASSDAICVVDVALALHRKNEFRKAKNYFELALKTPTKGEGYTKEYILYHYALTIESLQMPEEAKVALTQSCRLGMKSACERLKT